MKSMDGSITEAVMFAEYWNRPVTMLEQQWLNVVLPHKKEAKVS